MCRQIPVEEIQRKLKEVENTTIEEFFAEIDGTYSLMFVNGYKSGKRQALKELIEEE